MHCANCARQVQEAFERVDGVGHVETLLEQREVRIHGSSAMLPEKQTCLHVFETATGQTPGLGCLTKALGFGMSVFRGLYSCRWW